MITIIVINLVVMSGGYLAGRLHGKAAHHRFLAEGFRIMRDQATARGVGHWHMDDLSCSATDVSRAFGSRRIR